MNKNLGQSHFHQYSDIRADTLTRSTINMHQSYPKFPIGLHSFTDREFRIPYGKFWHFRSPSKHGRELQKHRKCSIDWHHQLMHMIVFALTGTLLAIGHHLFYSSLDGTISGSDQQQQWAHAFGNAFAILVVTSFATANKTAYHQYLWMIVRRKSFTIGAMDKLFSLTSNPLGFFTLELFRTTPLAITLALICW